MERGRRPVGAYSKRRLSADSKIIIELLKKQPQTDRELRENAKIPESTFYRVIGLLREITVKTDQGEVNLLKKANGGWALWFYRTIDEEVEEALLKLTAQGEASEIMIANEVGRPWTEIESSVYRMAKKHGLKIDEDEGGKIKVSRPDVRPRRARLVGIW